jgi:plasmid maintenance system antidote protein VapI
MIGSIIKKHLDEDGIKYSFVAKEAQIPINVFSAMINEKRKITAEEYFKICKVLKVDANYFANKVWRAS